MDGLIVMIVIAIYAADAAHAALPITYDIFFYYKLNEIKYYLKQIFIQRSKKIKWLNLNINLW